MGVRKKIVNSNRLVFKYGKPVVVDESGRKHRRFNRFSPPHSTEVFERERFKLNVIHAIAINVVLIVILLLTIFSR